MVSPTATSEPVRVAKLRDYGILDTPPEDAYDDLVRLATTICGTPISAVTLIDTDRQWFKSIVGLNLTETPRDIAFCDHTIRQNGLLVVNDTQADPRFADNPLVTGEPYVRFYAGAPLITDSGYALGTLCVIDVVPRSLTDAQADALRTLADAVMARMELTRQSSAWRDTFACSSGERIEDIRASPIFEAEISRRLCRLLSEIHDLTRHLQDQEDLRRSKERLELALEAGNLGTYFLNTVDGKYLDISPTCKIHYGFAADAQVTYEDVVALRHPDDSARVTQALADAQAGRHKFDVEYRVLWPDGSIHWLASHGSPTYSETGEATGVIGIARDITAVKEAEERVQRSDAGLIAAQRIAHLGSWEWTIEDSSDLAAGTLTWSDEVFRIWGYEPGAIKVTHENFLLGVHPEDQELIGEAVAVAVREHRTFDLIHRVVRPDGSERVVRERAEFEFAPSSGAPKRMVGTVLDITEQRRAEQATAQALSRLEAAQRIGQIGDWDFDVSSQKITWSPQVYEIFGRDPALGPPATYEENAALHDPESSALISRKMARAIETGEPQTYELTGHRPDGEPVHVYTVAVPRRNHDGKVTTISGTVQDITARKSAERLRRESEERFGFVLDAAEIGDWDMDLRTDVFHHSPRYDQCFGYDDAALVWGYDTFLSHVHPLDRDRVNDSFQEAKAGEGEYSAEFRVTWPDDSIHYLWIKGRFYFGHGVRPYRVAGIVLDITERRMAEERSRFDSLLLSQVHNAVIATDLEDRIIYWNAYAESLYQWKADEVLGRKIQDVTVPPQSFDRAEDILDEIFAGSDWDGYFDAQRKDGSIFPAHVSNSLFYDAEGEVAGVVGVSADITDLRRAADHIRELNKNLERRIEERTVQLASANQELEAFSYSVSHDLRAPLRSIDGFSQALLEDYAHLLDGPGQGFLDRIRAASRRMSMLIDDLLKLSRLTREVLRLEPVDMSAIARAISAELASSQPQRSVEVVIQPDLYANADPRLMRIALENLLSNAYKYTGSHATARIEFGRTEHEGKVCFFVRDDGAGFDMAYADKLFSAFQRMHTSQEFEGVGIGLATVKRILYRHGGRIWAEAAVEQGATFYFHMGNSTIIT